MAKETAQDSSVPLAEIAASLGLLVVVGQKLLSRVDAIAKLSGVELPDEAPPAAEASAIAEPIDQAEEDSKYVFAVAANHLGEKAVEVLRKLNDEQLSQLVTAGRSGDVDTVKVLLGLAQS